VAGTAAKLPAAVPTSRALAVPAEAKSARAAGGSRASGTFKLLVWVLVSLNVVAAGGWAYFKFMRNADARKALGTSRERLVHLKTNLDLLNATVRGIDQGNVNEVEDPAELIGGIADAMSIREFITPGIMNKQNFLKTNYTEKVVKITFGKKRVYAFGDIVSFLKEIEKANPTVQIKDVDFGKRTPANIGSDTWIPTNATVRTLQLTSTPGS
jgi:hypothetical protein